MEQEEQKLHIYLMAMGLLKSNTKLSRKQLELLLLTDSEKFSYMFFPTEQGTSNSISRREQHIRDIFLAYRLCYTHLLSLYA
jgi:hypothetical protein